jgi:hypothetical protein
LSQVKKICAPGGGGRNITALKASTNSAAYIGAHSAIKQHLMQKTSTKLNFECI